ncbi:MAG: ABC transporter ATP-binding protein [Dehalococcoidales bacterium]|nr:ABC transporter ATP-binding protein [Dehalococcoidales bacterium]
MYKIEDLSRIYVMGRVNVKALDGVSFAVPDGDMLAIMGRSGSGKSTLLKQIGMLDRPTSGSVTFQHDEVTRLPESKRARLRLQYLGYVFQEYALLGELTAHQNVYLPGMMLGLRNTDFKRRATELLEIVGLGARTNHYPRELSGGEQQRVAIARALINNPRIVLADEPCANLDTVSGRLVMETLARLNHELKVTIIFVSHDPADAGYARHKIVLSDGKICEDVSLK